MALNGLLGRRGQVLRETWDGRVGDWHEHVETDAFRTIRDALIAAAGPHDADDAVDLGAGTGFVTLPLARRVRSVLAVDLSTSMLGTLEARAARSGVDVTTRVADLSAFELPEASIDLVVSNYALHHLPDADKAALVCRAHGWLRPGGRLVIADMMFGRGRSARDRAIALEKVRALLRKGPGGIWRVVKNLVRFGVRIGMEQPSSPEAWMAMLSRAGFRDVHHENLAAEASLVSGRR